jgi:hypothetical protein
LALNSGLVILPIDVEQEISALQEHLGKIKKSDVLLHKSRSMKNSLAEYSSTRFVEKSDSIKPGAGTKQPANLRLDKVLSSHDGKKYLNIELCFNNRETAGTNFLKLSSAAKFQEQSGAVFSLGLLLVPKRELLNLGGWDPVYGDSMEYSIYFKEGFQESLFGNFLIIELSGSFVNSY